ncbi:hypothetical protein GCM10019017_24930 [Streptomyces showdoensis]
MRAGRVTLRRIQMVTGAATDDVNDLSREDKESRPFGERKNQPSGLE